MFANAKPSEQAALLAEISPVSQAAGAVVTGYVAAANFERFLAVIQTGVLGAGATVDAKIQQATDAAGTGAKDVAGKAIAQIAKATGDNKQALINVSAADLDVANGYSYIQVSLTVGTAASLVAASLFGFCPRFVPASDFNPASVVQNVG